MKDGYERDINYLRISITDLCNLRCRYCMKEEGIVQREHKDMMSFEEIIRFVKVASEHGIRKVRITGGEPLVKKDVISLLQQISQIEGIDELCITTNGTLLKQYASSLKQAHVSCVNISLDTLQSEKYTYMTRGGHIQDVKDGLLEALKYFDKVKINVVYMQGFNDDELDDFISLTKTYPIDVRFIELMPIGEAKTYSHYYASLQDVVENHPSLIPIEKQDGVARMYRLKDGKGRVGMIQAMSHSFCSTCNRLRLTSDGKLKPCLFALEEYDIKGCSEEEMEKILKQAIMKKPKSKEETIHTTRCMNEIGG